MCVCLYAWKYKYIILYIYDLLRPLCHETFNHLLAYVTCRFDMNNIPLPVSIYICTQTHSALNYHQALHITPFCVQSPAHLPILPHSHGMPSQKLRHLLPHVFAPKNKTTTKNIPAAQKCRGRFLRSYRDPIRCVHGGYK